MLSYKYKKLKSLLLLMNTNGIVKLYFFLIS